MAHRAAQGSGLPTVAQSPKVGHDTTRSKDTKQGEKIVLAIFDSRRGLRGYRDRSLAPRDLTEWMRLDVAVER